MPTNGTIDDETMWHLGELVSCLGKLLWPNAVFGDETTHTDWEGDCAWCGGGNWADGHYPDCEVRRALAEINRLKTWLRGKGYMLEVQNGEGKTIQRNN